MLSKRENFLETIRGGRPDRLVKQYEYMTLVKGDPVNHYVRKDRYPGMEPIYDAWGTRVLWPADEAGPTPDPRYQVLEDIEEWEDIVKVPDLIANCSAEELWAPYIEQAMAVDRRDTLLAVLSPTGVFERLHFLMGFEDTLCNFMLEPELMADLAAAIGEYKYNGFRLMVENTHPDAILSHDDWGSKHNLFVRPELWREIIKPAFKKPYSYIKEQGLLLIHHSDSFCEPIVEDMVELGIDMWQGILPQNNIPKLQSQLGGRMALQGGIDAAVVDRPDSSEEEIRAEVRRVCDAYCPAGHFIPSVTYGGPGFIHPGVDEIVNDEIDRWSAAHPEFFNK